MIYKIFFNRGEGIYSYEKVKKDEVIKKIIDKEITHSKASDLLYLSTRQIKRLCKNCRENEPQSLYFTKKRHEL